MELDPTAVKVAVAMARMFGCEAESDGDALCFLASNHFAHLWSMISDITNICQDQFEGETGPFEEFVTAYMTEDHTLH